MALLNSSSIKEFLYNPKQRDEGIYKSMQGRCIDIGNRFPSSYVSLEKTKEYLSVSNSKIYEKHTKSNRR